MFPRLGLSFVGSHRVDCTKISLLLSAYWLSVFQKKKYFIVMLHTLVELWIYMRFCITSLLLKFLRKSRYLVAFGRMNIYVS